MGKTIHKVDEAVSLKDLKNLTKIYKNILPPLSLLSDIEKKDLKENLSNLNFSLSTSMAA